MYVYFLQILPRYEFNFKWITFRPLIQYIVEIHLAAVAASSLLGLVSLLHTRNLTVNPILPDSSSQAPSDWMESIWTSFSRSAHRCSVGFSLGSDWDTQEQLKTHNIAATEVCGCMLLVIPILKGELGTEDLSSAWCLPDIIFGVLCKEFSLCLIRWYNLFLPALRHLYAICKLKAGCHCSFCLSNLP